MLTFQSVRKEFGGIKVLDIPDSRLPNGIYWLHGANGSGKTTLLRMIAGILPFAGDIFLEGHSQRREPVQYRRLVAWSDAEPLYPAYLKGSELLHFYQGILRPATAQVNRLCDLLGVSSWLGAPMAAWSGGMTKKMSLLLAFLGRPALIALDEPYVALDDAGRSAADALIEEYRYLYRTGFLISSHQALTLTGVRQLLIDKKSIQLKV